MDFDSCLVCCETRFAYPDSLFALAKAAVSALAVAAVTVFAN